MNVKVKDFIPSSWMSLVQIKRDHFKALADYQIGITLLGQQNPTLHDNWEGNLLFLYNFFDHDDESAEKPEIPDRKEDLVYLGKHIEFI